MSPGLLGLLVNPVLSSSCGRATLWLSQPARSNPRRYPQGTKITPFPIRICSPVPSQTHFYWPRSCCEVQHPPSPPSAVLSPRSCCRRCSCDRENSCMRVPVIWSWHQKDHAKANPRFLPGETKTPWEEGGESDSPRTRYPIKQWHLNWLPSSETQMKLGRQMDCSPSAWKCGVLAEASKPASFCAQGSDKQGAHLLSFLFFFPPQPPPPPSKGQDLGHVYHFIAAFVQSTHMNAVLRLTTALISFTSLKFQLKHSVLYLVTCW